MIIPRYVATDQRKVAVLTPNQVDLIEDRLNSDYKLRTRYLLETHARLKEAIYIDGNRQCYRREDGMIDLPHVKGMGKARCTIAQRTIFLSKSGIKAVDSFFAENAHLPVYQSMSPAIKLAAEEADFDTQYITPKMYRKTMISWLINCYPELETKILHSAGHDILTMRGSYLSMGFRKEDVKEMRDRTDGWGIYDELLAPS